MNTEDIKQHYNRAAENRAARLKSPAMNVSQFNHRLRERILRGFLARVSPRERGVDMGTGTGVWAEVLTEYCANVVGIDFAEENIRVATESAAEQGLGERLSYRVGDAQTLDGIAPSSFDVAMQISVLQHLPDKPACLQRIYETLDTNGALVLLVHNRNCIYNHNLRSQRKRGGQVSVNEYTSLTELRGLVEGAGFQVVEIRHVWLFVNDLLFLGINRPILRPFAPLRRLAAGVLSGLDGALGRCPVFNPLFREMVVLATKETERSR